MQSIDAARERLSHLDRLAGSIARDLAVGEEVLRFEGLTDAWAALLSARWGGFFTEPKAASARLTVRMVRTGSEGWLPRWQPGERYRVEADAAGGPLVVRSYHFALGPEISGAWRLAVTDPADEPAGRVLDNAARYLVARIATEAGGVALHGAAVRRDGRATIFAGASGSGKSTAVRLAAPAESLGDDFAVVLPAGNGWAVPALPFDNAETAPADPIRGLTELHGVWRIFKADRHRVERPTGVRAQASLLACAAFPWALPDLADRAGEAVAKLAASGRFAHLHFALDPAFWPLIADPA